MPDAQPYQCPTLETPAFWLHPLSSHHKALIFKIRSDESVRRYLDRSLMQTPGEAEAFIDTIEAGTAQGKYLYWVIAPKTGQPPLGTLCLWQFNPERTAADIGYELLPHAQGRGVMREAMGAVLQYARDGLRLHWVHAFTHAENAPSIRLLRHFGFSQAGNNASFRDDLVYSKPTGGLPAYLERIGLPPGSRPGLTALHAAHLYHIPFENLDIHWRRPISIAFEDVYQKLVHRRRGGFCYEHNNLFAWALRELGYRAHLIQAQVYSTEQQAYGPPFDHMAVWVELPEGPLLADVGFGNSPLFPIPIRDGASADHESGHYRIDQLDGNSYRLSHREAAQWVPDYIFDAQPRRIEAFAAMAHYHQTAPASPFPNKRLITLARPGGNRVTISGDTLKFTIGGREETQPVKDEAHFESLLRQHFWAPPSDQAPSPQ